MLRQRFLADGRCQTTAIYFSDDVINLKRFVRHTPNTDHLLALRGTVLASVEPDMVSELRGTSLSGVDGMATLVLRELGIAQERLINLGQRNSLQAMAYFFCEAILRSLEPDRHKSQKRCYLPLTQNALAEILGMSSVHVNWTLGHLRVKRSADLSNFELVVHDFEAPADVAEFDDAYLTPI